MATGPKKVVALPPIKAAYDSSVASPKANKKFDLTSESGKKVNGARHLFPASPVNTLGKSRSVATFEQSEAVKSIQKPSP